LNEWAVGPEFFDVSRFPQAHFIGKLTGFKDGGEPHVAGQLTLHGVTHPVELEVDGFSMSVTLRIQVEATAAQ
jgi:polyisoprenoid-binding protein YceI